MTNKFLLITLLLLLCHATLSKTISIKDGKVAPMDLTAFSLERFIKEFAISSDIRISYSKDTIKSNDKIDFYLRHEIPQEEFLQSIIRILENKGLTMTMLKDSGGWSIVETRDIRFAPVEIYNSNSYPDTNEYITVIHKMKFPLADSTIRNLRSSVSRHARIVSFSDGRTIVINEIGTATSELLKIIESLDTKENYEQYLQGRESKAIVESKKTPKEKSIEELNNTIAELEKENESLKSIKTPMLGKKNSETKTEKEESKNE
ncbi:MAG: hypothetical protein A2504_09590 [Bdellovibrionales bacterium RIFOXYD12_FULL_39_22]|nr:MAG: hypothetical protein A2385_13080 [Bdellovibrionales bacterium RIFOXYB1_FULL_39_21]OFZ40979.1 MAG: hypothetical protein A2485_16590 [Bdellovibrionales bacterium RIFOXYC12_FULL_39_17]OFZ44807.1 MAG: hypothetical protein A2404_09880 [Bdellovibrionales bacterium RIFOXYC1_FULL_39_130]OFZ69346.1 MAG: hypothetical protein A2451_01000 [Bdellovibrionales bacterium RIFOXYC2_FULL_39_8]OFZ74272.1 MAG: hypothetical protein A2560_16845 [Bdellovibrionales bacterium RIFOXYD1_FULL_39_84]OFZ92136.1 MAG: